MGNDPAPLFVYRNEIPEYYDQNKIRYVDDGFFI